MHSGIRFAFVLTCCLAIAAGVVCWLGVRSGWSWARPSADSITSARPDQETDPYRVWLSDAGAAGGDTRLFVERRTLDNAVGSLNPYAETIKDPTSLGELRDALRMRGPREMVSLRARYDGLNLGSPPTSAQAIRAIPLARAIAYASMQGGEFDQAARWLETGLELSQLKEFPPIIRAEFHALLGINALRRGEIENCLECAGPSSCILPIAPAAVHRRKDGSREAIRQFTEYLKSEPGDLRVRWLLNLAYMTLGEYPDGVPREYLVPLDGFRSKLDVGRFENVASAVGLTARGPNLAGGSILDDFDGDGLVDVFSTSIDCDRGASLFLNSGNGSFRDHSASAGLDSEIYVLNAVRGDYDNDGDPDILLLRGAWDVPAPLSLLRNRGDGSFEDVARASGLGEPISSESAAWGDFDNDGWLDLFVCGEFHNSDPDPARASSSRPVGVGSITTSATAPSRTSRPRPESPTSGWPRARRGVTSTATAGSTCSSRACERIAGSTTTRATEPSRTSRTRWASRAARRASRAGSGTSTTTACSTFSSTITTACSPTSWHIISAGKSR